VIPHGGREETARRVEKALTSGPVRDRSPKEEAMSRFKRMIGRKAARATVRHTAHGVSAKVRRKPLRSASLISVGAILGSAATLLRRRRSTA
jgi:hypothetical protein